MSGNLDEIVLDEDFDLDIEERVEEKPKANDTISYENIEKIELTKNINLLIFKFMAYSTLYLALIGVIFLEIFTYKNLEKMLLLPILLLFIHQCVLIIKTIQKNSFDHLDISDKGFQITDNKNAFFIDFSKVAKVEIHTHRYTHFGMFKIVSITTESFKTYNIIFKVDYDEDAIIDRIKCRLQNHDVALE